MPIKIITPTPPPADDAWQIGSDKPPVICQCCGQKFDDSGHKRKGPFTSGPYVYVCEWCWSKPYLYFPDKEDIYTKKTYRPIPAIRALDQYVDKAGKIITPTPPPVPSCPLEPKGTCFADAYKALMTKFSDQKEVILIHGMIDQVDNRGQYVKRIKHAWIEMMNDGTIYDPTWGFVHPVTWKQLHPETDESYTFEEAGKLVIHTKHLGPWTPSDRLKILGSEEPAYWQRSNEITSTRM